MRSEKEKMLACELYDPHDPELVAVRNRARDLCQDLNATRESEQEVRRTILRELFGQGGDSVWMQPPFFCDYGKNILLGERVFFNFNCIVLDVCQVKIGNFTLFGPAVQIYTATHPMNAELRRTQEFSKPIEPAGVLITGESFNDIRGLKHILATTRHLNYYYCLSEKCAPKNVP